MLINNLQKHKQKYSQQTKSIFKNHCQSSTKINSSRKVQTNTPQKSNIRSSRNLPFNHDLYTNTAKTQGFLSKFQCQNWAQIPKMSNQTLLKTNSSKKIQRINFNQKTGAHINEEKMWNTQGKFSFDRKSEKSKTSINNVNSFSTKDEVDKNIPKKAQMTNFMKTLANIDMEKPKLSTNQYSTPQRVTIQTKQKQPHKMDSSGTHKQNYKSIVIDGPKIPQIEKEQEALMKNIKLNEVFFCGGCYRYIFGIQKSYHYPVCQNKVDINIKQNEKHKIGLQRLKLLVELSNYSSYKTQEINKVYSEISNGRNPESLSLKEHTLKTYYSFTQIQQSAYAIIAKLIYPLMELQGSFVCHNAGCHLADQF